MDPLETDTNRVPWEFAVHFDESDAVGERDLASAATAIGCAQVSVTSSSLYNVIVKNFKSPRGRN